MLRASRGRRRGRTFQPARAIWQAAAKPLLSRANEPSDHHRPPDRRASGADRRLHAAPLEPEAGARLRELAAQPPVRLSEDRARPHRRRPRRRRRPTTSRSPATSPTSACRRSTSMLSPGSRASGSPRRVSVIPGNHDIYSRLGGDPGTRALGCVHGLGRARGRACRATARRFPFVRMVGEVALIGLNSAVPTPPLVASGRLGAGQLAACRRGARAPRPRRRLPAGADPPSAAAGPGQALPRSGGRGRPGDGPGAARGRARHPWPQPPQHAGLVRHRRGRQAAGRRRAVRVAGTAPQGRAAGALQSLPHRRPAVDDRADRPRPRAAGRSHRRARAADAPVVSLACRRVPESN